MGLFSKATYIETTLDFKIQEYEYCCEEEHEKYEAGGMIDFEGYGRVGEELENRYYYAMVACKNIIYNEFVSTLVNMPDKRLKVIVKVRNGKVKRFKIDFKDLARKLNDDRYEQLYILDGGVPRDKTNLF